MIQKSLFESAIVRVHSGDENALCTHEKRSIAHLMFSPCFQVEDEEHMKEDHLSVAHRALKRVRHQLCKTSVSSYVGIRYILQTSCVL